MTNPKKLFLTLAGAAAAFTALVSFAPAANAQNYGGGDYCREYTRTVTIGNRREEAYGTACLQPDGQWQIVDEGDLRPVNYDNYVNNTNRTVVVRQPTQIVYRDRTPTRVFFFGTPRRYDNHRHYYRYDRHDHDHRWNGRGRGHDRHDHRGRGWDHD